MAFAAGQLVAVVGASLLAMVAAPHVLLVPASFDKHTPLTAAQAYQIVAIFIAFQMAASALSWAAMRRPPWAGLRRCILELYLAAGATSLAASTMFLFTVVPFSPNFYAWAYALVISLNVILILVWHRVAKRPMDEADLPVWGLLVSPWTVVAAVVIGGPGVLAIAYKKDRDFANLVNATRIHLNASVDSRWTLNQAYPGRTFEQPLFLQFAPDDDQTFYLLSRTGRLSRYRTSPEWREDLLLDISDEVATVDVEMGAFSFALHPEFGKPGSVNRGFVYVWYTHFDDDKQYNRLARFDVSLSTLEERNASRFLMIDLERPPNGAHNGGTLQFDQKGMLFLSVGDFGDVSNSQRLDGTLASGILRIDVDRRGLPYSTPIARQPKNGRTGGYFIPTDNPWHGEPDALEEYWAIGFRNPFRMFFDAPTETVWLGDVGEDKWEEQNVVAKGDNGQWPFMEGRETIAARPTKVYGREIEPFYAYRHTAMARAALGGLVYRGTRYPSLRGQYLFADNNEGTIRLANPQRMPVKPQTVALAGQFGQMGITGLFTDPSGRILVTSLGSKLRPDGEVLELVPEDPDAPLAQTAVAAWEATTINQKYEQICARCHGVDGHGHPELASLVQRPPDFTSDTWQAGVTDEHIRRVITEGGAAVGLSVQMPAWGTLFTDAELALMVQKIRAFHGAPMTDAQ